MIQRSICLFHGCQQCLLPSLLWLAIINCFTKGVPCVEEQGQGNAPLTFVPPAQARMGGLRGFQMTGALFNSLSILTTDQDINSAVAINDLLERDADSKIFEKLGLTYGQALQFKGEFGKLMPPSRYRRSSIPELRMVVSCQVSVLSLDNYHRLEMLGKYLFHVASPNLNLTPHLIGWYCLAAIEQQ